jgi:hypothetical protein
VCFAKVTILVSVKILHYCTYINIVTLAKQKPRLPVDGFVKPKHVGAFIAFFNVNFNILK